MKFVLTFAFLSVHALSFFANAAPPVPNVVEIPGLPGGTVEVRFTNPDCPGYEYEDKVKANSGVLLTNKPTGVFCSRGDYSGSDKWFHSPQNKLVEWINDPSTTEIFFTYLSASNKSVLTAICKAVKSRGVKVTFVLDTSSDTSATDNLLQDLNCEVNQEVENYPIPRFIPRGHTGTNDSENYLENDYIGYAHNKVFLINPNDPKTIKYAVSSGNLSAGVVIHHENWLFFTVPTQSYLAQAHLCLMQAQLDDAAHENKNVYAKVNQACLKSIPYSKTPSVTPYFVPGNAYSAIRNVIVPSIASSEKVTIAAHRLAMGQLVSALTCAAKAKGDDAWGCEKGSTGKAVRMIVDDDMYWLEKTGNQVGDNMAFEVDNLVSVREAGGNGKVKYMQTNHGEHFLHHNKILLFEGGKTPGVWTGAGNFTGAAFNSNFENFYHITIPAITEIYKQQLDYVWENMATSWDEMPVEDAAVKTTK